MSEKSNTSESPSIQTKTLAPSDVAISLPARKESDEDTVVTLAPIPQTPGEDLLSLPVGTRDFFPDLGLLVPAKVAGIKTSNLQGVLDNLKMYFQSRIVDEATRTMPKGHLSLVREKNIKLLDELLTIIQTPGIDETENEIKLSSICSKCPSILDGIETWPNSEKIAASIVGNIPELFPKLPSKLRKSEHYGKLLLENNKNLGDISSFIPEELIDIFAKKCVKNSAISMLIAEGKLSKNDNFTDKVFSIALKDNNIVILTALSKHKKYLQKLESDANYQNFALSFLDSNPKELLDVIRKDLKKNPAFLLLVLERNNQLIQEFEDDQIKIIAPAISIKSLENLVWDKKSGREFIKTCIKNWGKDNRAVEKIAIIAKNNPEYFDDIVFPDKIYDSLMENIDNWGIMKYAKKRSGFSADTKKADLDTAKKLVENPFAIENVSTYGVLMEYISLMNSENKKISVAQIVKAESSQKDNRIKIESPEWAEIYQLCVENHPDNFQFLDSKYTSDPIFIEKCLDSCYKKAESTGAQYKKDDIHILRYIHTDLKKNNHRNNGEGTDNDSFLVNLAKKKLIKSKDLFEIGADNKTLRNMIKILQKNGENIQSIDEKGEVDMSKIEYYRQNPHLLAGIDLDPTDQAHRAFAEAILKLRGSAITFMGDIKGTFWTGRKPGMIHDKDMAMLAVEQNGVALRFLPSEFRKDENFNLKAISETTDKVKDKDLEAYQFIDESFKNNADFLGKLVKRNPDTLQHVGYQLFLNQNKKGFDKAKISSILNSAYGKIRDGMNGIIFSHFQNSEFVKFVGDHCPDIEKTSGYIYEKGKSEITAAIDEGVKGTKFNVKEQKNDSSTIGLFVSELSGKIDSANDIKSKDTLKDIFKNETFKKALGDLLNNPKDVPVLLGQIFRDAIQPLQPEKQANLNKDTLKSWTEFIFNNYVEFGKKLVIQTQEKSEINFGLKKPPLYKNGVLDIKLFLEIQSQRGLSLPLDNNGQLFNTKLDTKFNFSINQSNNNSQPFAPNLYNAASAEMRKKIGISEETYNLALQEHLGTTIGGMSSIFGSKKVVEATAAVALGTAKTSDVTKIITQVAKEKGLTHLVKEYEAQTIYYVKIEVEQAKKQEQKTQEKTEKPIEKKVEEPKTNQVEAPIGQVSTFFFLMKADTPIAIKGESNVSVTRTSEGTAIVRDEKSKMEIKTDPKNIETTLNSLNFLREIGVDFLGKEAGESFIAGINIQRGRHFLPPLDLSAGPTLENKRFILGFLTSLSNPELFSREQIKISALEEYFRGINKNQKNISSVFENKVIQTVHIGPIPLLGSGQARPDAFRQAVVETSDKKYDKILRLAA